VLLKSIDMKTSKLITGLTVLACCLILMGCPYESAVPLSEAKTKAADNLIGVWEESGNSNVTMTVERGSGNMLKITKTTVNEGMEPTIEDYNAHITDINGKMFFNVSEISDYESEPNYYIYKVEKSGEFKMILFEVTPNIREKFTSSDEMKAFFTANMNNSYFYSTGEVTYFKIK
jgi:hypothetical protein